MIALGVLIQNRRGDNCYQYKWFLIFGMCDSLAAINGMLLLGKGGGGGGGGSPARARSPNPPRDQ